MQTEDWHGPPEGGRDEGAPPVEELLLRWEQAREQGQPVTPEELCRDCPEYLPALRRCIALLGAVDEVMDLGATADHPPRGPEEFPEIPGYEIEAELDRGGMGVVYRARHRILGQPRAVKVIRPGLGVHPNAVRRFEREMKLLAGFEHEHIVPVYEAGLAGDSPYFVMPLVRGGSLRTHMGRFRADVRAAVGLMAKVAGAVHHAHQSGIVHRDLKPGNILMTEDGKPLVSDFGIAKLLERDAPEVPDPPVPPGPEVATPPEAPVAPAAAPNELPGAADAVPPTIPMVTRLTQEGFAVGTPPYMAPEQLAGELARVGPATDVWALGVVLYELLTRTLPFPGANAPEVAARIREGDPPPPHRLRPEADRALSAIVLRCLRPQPADRYPSAAALADDLGRWLRGEPVAGESLGRWARRQVRRWRVPGAIGLALTVLAAVALRYGPSETRTPEELYREAVAPLLEKLSRGERVTLIGPGVEPVYLHTFGAGRILRKEGLPQGAIAFASDGPARLELLPRVPAPRNAYRIEAEIAHAMAYDGWNQYVGICLAGTDLRTAAGTQHLFLLCGLAEAGSFAVAFGEQAGELGGGAFVAAFLTGEDPTVPYRCYHYLWKDRVGFIPREGGQPYPPRRITVEVRPGTFSARLGDEPEPFARLGPAELGRRVDALRIRLPLKYADLAALPVHFPEDGSLGVTTRDSEVIITRLEVIPAAE